VNITPVIRKHIRKVLLNRFQRWHRTVSLLWLLFQNRMLDCFCQSLTLNLQHIVYGEQQNELFEQVYLRTYI
jgi:hypothetical protein